MHALVSSVRAMPAAQSYAAGVVRPEAVASFFAHGGGGGDDAEKAAKTALAKSLDLVMIGALVLLGGIFAGLTLGLMGLDWSTCRCS